MELPPLGTYTTRIHTLGEHMSNRETWEFTYSGEELLAAVKGQLAGIKILLAQTKKELDDAKKALQKAGFDFEDGNLSMRGDHKITNKLNSLQYALVGQEKRQKDLHRWSELLKKGADYNEYLLRFADHSFFFPEHVVHEVKKPVKKAVAKPTPKEKPVKAIIEKVAPKKEHAEEKPKASVKAVDTGPKVVRG